MGYSIGDPHIQEIIISIAKCLPENKIGQFQDNLIFVSRVKGEERPSFEKATFKYEFASITMRVAKVSSYDEVFKALVGGRRKIPARVLRFFREQVYELVHSNSESNEKVAVVDYEDIENAEDIEFVVGVGVAKSVKDFGKKTEDRLASRGYSGVDVNELFEDCLSDESQFDGANLLKNAFPIYTRQGSKTFIPVFRYLRSAGIENRQQLECSNFEAAKKVVSKLDKANFTYPSYRKRFSSSFKELSMSEIIGKSSSSKEASIMLNFLVDEDIDAELLRTFLKGSPELLEAEPYRSQFRKLVCRYDRLVYGF